MGAAEDEPRTSVVFDDPVPTGPAVAKASADDEECKTGCSLAKHSVPDFTEADYHEALAAYASAPVDVSSEGLDKLLFYGTRTKKLMQELGTEALPPSHVEFLRRELSRDHALVSLRLVDEAGTVRVAYGPTPVPLGVKQHLQPAGKDLQAMEFNGTVMRTGVNYLWSRY